MTMPLHRGLVPFVALATFWVSGAALAAPAITLTVLNEPNDQGEVILVRGDAVEVEFVVEDALGETHRRDRVRIVRMDNDSVVQSTSRGNGATDDGIRITGNLSLDTNRMRSLGTLRVEYVSRLTGDIWAFSPTIVFVASDLAVLELANRLAAVEATDPVPGPAGPQGPQGPIGPAGPDGAVGATGPEGPQGPIGPAGPDGAVGATGPEGPQGPIGPAGPDGAVGATGPVGPSGAPGLDGAPGESVYSVPVPIGHGACPDGGTEFASVSGLTYACNGAQGLTGPEGSDGPAGPRGLPGPEGPQGPRGPPGPPGPAADEEPLSPRVARMEVPGIIFADRFDEIDVHRVRFGFTASSGSGPGGGFRVVVDRVKVTMASRHNQAAELTQRVGTGTEIPEIKLYLCSAPQCTDEEVRLRDVLVTSFRYLPPAEFGDPLLLEYEFDYALIELRSGNERVSYNAAQEIVEGGGSAPPAEFLHGTAFAPPPGASPIDDFGFAGNVEYTWGAGQTRVVDDPSFQPVNLKTTATKDLVALVTRLLEGTPRSDFTIYAWDHPTDSQAAHEIECRDALVSRVEVSSSFAGLTVETSLDYREVEWTHRIFDANGTRVAETRRGWDVRRTQGTP